MRKLLLLVSLLCMWCALLSSALAQQPPDTVSTETIFNKTRWDLKLEAGHSTMVKDSTTGNFLWNAEENVLLAISHLGLEIRSDTLRFDRTSGTLIAKGVPVLIKYGDYTGTCSAFNFNIETKKGSLLTSATLSGVSENDTFNIEAETIDISQNTDGNFFFEWSGHHGERTTMVFSGLPKATGADDRATTVPVEITQETIDQIPEKPVSTKEK